LLKNFCRPFSAGTRFEVCIVMRDKGFTYAEVLVSLFLLLFALLFLGRTNMTSLHLIGKGKMSQRASLLLLEKIEELRAVPLQELLEGQQEEQRGSFLLQWRIQTNTPYFGTRQIQCRVLYRPAASVIVESIFYRSE
jgi:hypothetical protein